MRSLSVSDSNNTTVNYYTNSSYGFTARDCESVKVFSFDNLLLSLRMSSQNLYIVKPAVAREIFVSDNAKYLSVFSPSNDTFVSGDNISATERLAA
jgi:hypothetical protein